MDSFAKDEITQPVQDDEAAVPFAAGELTLAGVASPAVWAGSALSAIVAACLRTRWR